MKIGELVVHLQSLDQQMEVEVDGFGTISRGDVYKRDDNSLVLVLSSDPDVHLPLGEEDKESLKFFSAALVAAVGGDQQPLMVELVYDKAQKIQEGKR